MVSTQSQQTQHAIGILTGPTASGKSALSIEFAQAYPDLEIISADSLLVYQGLDIGTAKPSLQERQQVPHHLIDLCQPNETFTTGDFLEKAKKKINEIHEQRKRVLIVGGSGFYIQALLFGMWDAPASDPSIKKKLSFLPETELFEQLKQIDSTAAQRIGLKDRYRLIRALELFQLTGETPTAFRQRLPKTPNPQFHLWWIDLPPPLLAARIAQRTQKMGG